MACPGCSPDFAPNLVACTGKGQRVRKVAHGKVPCMHNNAAELPCERLNKLVVHVLACSQNETPFWTKSIKTNATCCSIKHKFCQCSPKLLWSLQRIGEMMALVAFSKSHPSSFQSRMVWPPVVLVVGGSSHKNMSSGLIHDVSFQSH